MQKNQFLKSEWCTNHVLKDECELQQLKEPQLI